MAKHRPTTTPPAAEQTRPVERLTQTAFVLALALAVARITFSDFSRESGEPLGSEAPRGAGPATAIALDLLCCVPAILVLARRVSDRQYVLRAAWSIVPLGLLAALGLASTLWASNKFAALIMAMHLIAAAALLWAMSQLVRSWLRLRLVASLVAGLLLAYFGHTLIYKTIDLPDLKRNWEKDRKQILENRGLADDPFLAKQFENKVLSGELMGFFVSPNSFAAVVVLLLIVTTGVAAQRLLDDPRDASGYALLVLWPLAVWMILQTGSRTAYLTPVLGIALLAAVWLARDHLARHATKLFYAGLALVTLTMIAVVAHGLYHKSLVMETLTFRWNYWIGAARIVREHPILGVGLENFGLHYTAARLPQAAEEIKDPHNLVVRLAAELGLVGAALGLAWLIRLAWELTRPNTPPDAPAPVQPSTAGQYNGLKTIALVAGVAMLLNVVASIDFTADGVFVFNEILRRCKMLALIILGAAIAAVRSLKDPALDPRPAPLALYGLLIALAIFLLHNTIDFSIFEPGPLTLFAALAGAALGVRHPSVAGHRRKTVAAAVALGAGCVAWLVLAVFVYAPTAIAEDAAHDANVALRNRRPDQAVKLFLSAREHQPLNADYAFKAAQIIMGSAPPSGEQILGLLQSAIHTSPRDVSFYLTRARHLLNSPTRNARNDQILADFKKAVELNPHEVALRVEFGDALKQLGDREEAAAQYRAAIEANAKLKQIEPKRLTGQRLADLERRLAEVTTVAPPQR